MRTTNPFYRKGLALSISLSDSRGYHYSPAAGYPKDLTFPSGELQEGETVSGTLTFKIPSDAKGLVVRYSASLIPEGTINVALDGSARTRLESLPGTKVKEKGFDLTVSSVERTDQTFISAKDGQEFLVLDLALDNKTIPVLRHSWQSFKLRDRNGVEIEPDVLTDFTHFRYANINPGERHRGRVSFVIPKDSTGFELLFEADEPGAPAEISVPIKE